MKIDPYKHKEQFEKWLNSTEGKSKINVNENILVHKKINLNKAEINFLKRKKFYEQKFKSCFNGKNEKYFIKPRFNESPTHLFVIYDILNYLLSKKIKADLYTTREPDIVFTLNNKTFAIEVETGAIIYKKNRIYEKLDVLKKYDFWFFVVTNRNFVSKYKEYGKVTDLRYLRGQIDRILAKEGISHLP